MPSPETRPVSERRTELSPPADILRRLLFLFVALGGPAGAILLIYGLVQGGIVFAICGGALAGLALVTWIKRNAWGGDATVRELKDNPFKPRREPKE